jgi:hypothetical protein
METHAGKSHKALLLIGRFHAATMMPHALWLMNGHCTPLYFTFLLSGRGANEARKNEGGTACKLRCMSYEQLSSNIYRHPLGPTEWRPLLRIHMAAFPALPLSITDLRQLGFKRLTKI